MLREWLTLAGEKLTESGKTLKRRGTNLALIVE